MSDSGASPRSVGWLDKTTLAFLNIFGFHSLDPRVPTFAWPGLHNLVQRIPPVVKAPWPYGAAYKLNLLSASGTSCLFSVFASAAHPRVSPAKLVKWTGATANQLKLPLLTIASMVALAYL